MKSGKEYRYINKKLSVNTKLALSTLLIGWAQVGLSAELPTVDCVITPFLTVDVSSPVPGVLAEVMVDRSDTVEKGQLVAALDSDVEKAAVALAEAKVDQIADIELSKVNLAFDERKNNRLDSLYNSKSVSDEAKDEAERNVMTSRYLVEHKRGIRIIRRHELSLAEERLNQKSIKSPIDGIVIQRFKTASEYVEDQPILRIAQLDPLYVEAIVPIEMFGQIKPGMQAEVFPETYAKDPVNAKVTTVDRMGDAASGTFGVRLTLPNPDHKLPAGLKCHVQFENISSSQPSKSGN